MMKITSRGVQTHLVLAATLALTLVSGCSVSLNSHKSGDLLIVDDFGSRRLNWQTWQQPGGTSASYLDGGFVLVVEPPNADAVSTNGENFDNLDIKVSAGKIAGTDDNHYGVVCRYQDQSNYYGFLITSDGYFGILRVKDGVYQMLPSGNFDFSHAINQEKSQNVIQAVCLQNLLVLKVNGQQLAMVTDDSFTTGKVGMIAGTFDDPNLAVKFDNLAITVP